MIYMAIEIYPSVQAATHGEDPSHNVIASPEEMANWMKDYRGAYHKITGFYTEDEVSGMSLTDRGFADREEEVDEDA